MSVLKYKDPVTGEVKKVGTPVAIGKSTVVNTTLLASGWIDGTYTVSSESITTTSIQEVVPAIDVTAEQLQALQSANIQDAGQANGSLTIKAYGDVPTIDIPIRIVVSGLDVVAAAIDLTPIDSEINTQTDLIAQIQAEVDAKSEDGGGSGGGWSETISGSTLIITTGVR